MSRCDSAILTALRVSRTKPEKFLDAVLFASGPETGGGLWVVRGAARLVTLSGGSGGSENSLHKYNWSPSVVQKTRESSNIIVAGCVAIAFPASTLTVVLKLLSLLPSEDILASLYLFRFILVMGFGSGGQRHAPPSLLRLPA